jgi:hypothetical protein
MLRACDQISRLNERWRDRRYMGAYFWPGEAWKRRKARNTVKAAKWYVAFFSSYYQRVGSAAVPDEYQRITNVNNVLASKWDHAATSKHISLRSAAATRRPPRWPVRMLVC